MKKITASPGALLSWGESPFIGRESGESCLRRATPPGTGNAQRADPVASLGNARPSQRALRGGLSLRAGLRYVLIPWEKNHADIRSPDKAKYAGAGRIARSTRW